MTIPNRANPPAKTMRGLWFLLGLCAALACLDAAMAAILGDGALAVVVTILVAVTVTSLAAGHTAEKRTS